MTRAPAPQAHESIRRSTVFAVGVQLSGTIFTAALTLFLVRALGRGDYGVFSIAVAIATLVQIPTDFGISASAARSIAEAYGNADRLRAVLAVALRLKVLVSIVVGALVVLAAPEIARIYGNSKLTGPVRAMGVVVAAQSMLAFTTSAFTALRRMRTVLGIVTIESAVETLASVALVLGGAGLMGASTGRAIGYLAGAIFGVALLLLMQEHPLALLRAGFDRTIARAMTLYAGAIVVIDVIWAVLSQIDVLIMGFFLSTAAVASFQAPSRFVSLATYPGLAFAKAVAPRMARGTRDAAMVATLGETARRLVVIQAFGAAAVVVLAPQIVAVALGHSYEHTASESVLRVLGPYVLLSGLAPLFSNAIDYVGGARRRIWIAAATLAVNAGLNVALVPRIGPTGAAIAVDVSYGLFVGAHTRLCRDLVGLAVEPLLRTAAVGTIAAGAAIGVAAVIGLSNASVLGLALKVVLGLGVFAGIVLVRGEHQLLLPGDGGWLGRRPAQVPPGPDR